jgi:hypothetical protein
MSMDRQDNLADTPFNGFICTGCGRTMGSHWVFRPDRMGDVTSMTRHSGRKAPGLHFCHRDGSTASPGHFQRVLRRSLEPAGYKT